MFGSCVWRLVGADFGRPTRRSLPLPGAGRSKTPQREKNKATKKKIRKSSQKIFHFWKASHTNKVQKLYLL